MKLPEEFKLFYEWTFVGPMGPNLPSNLLSHPVIAVDGGSRFTDKVDIWLGDGDSRPSEVNSRHLFRYPSIKSESDLTLSLNLFDEDRPYLFHLWGFLGGRKDHELFNLGETLNFLEQRPKAQIFFYDEQGRILFQILGAGEWGLKHLGVFSIGTLKEQKIKLIGECQYQLIEETLIKPLSSLGLSNEGAGKFSLYNRHPLFIYYPEGK
ncbi:MAG: hypothetical protein AB7I27_16665 [Bacteriovoracaceae bacterium]